VLAGGGSLPALVVQGALGRGWGVNVVTFGGQPQPDGIPASVGQVCFNIAGVGRIVAHLKAKKVTHVVLAGHLHKPSLFSLRPDAKGLALLARVRGFHDDAVLRAVTGLLHDEGFTVMSVPEIVPDVRAAAGVWGKLKPTAADEADIALGFEVVRAMGALDIGQAVVVHKGVVLGVEGVEGTDALIARCAALRGPLKKGEKAGWLVKAAKPAQTDLADLPTVGAATARTLATHGYKGLAVEAGRTLVLGLEEMRKAEIVLVGVDGPGA
ncbi:MAG: UDP-2,3-diacylglucosamine diphosphatase LpxI, partial [Alphaproteobacteria bacterium]